MATEEELNTNIDDISDKVAELLNVASISQKDSERLTNLKHVQELIVRKHPNLLDNFLEEVIQFQLDKSTEIKKFVVSFIEEACKRDNETIFKVIDNFRYLLFDENVNVQKRAYLAMINIFKNTLKWISRRKLPIDEHHKQTLFSLLDIKNHIAAQLDSDNDGIRTTAIKFLEMLIICLSPRIKESLVPVMNENDFSIDQIHDQNFILDKFELLEEGRHHMKKLLEYTLSTHISSVNLISSICVLSNIAKQRPEFMETVLETFSKILSNMPPTLGKSQVSTVRKQMKLQIVSICKNPCCIEFQTQIVQIMTDLGASQSEISKTIPRVSNNDMKKRLLSSVSSINESNSPLYKKPKLQTLKSKEESMGTSVAQQSQKTDLPSLDNVVDDLVVKLNVQDNVADLVLVSMAFLPEQMTPVFQNTYKPISAAGTLQQIRNLAKMLAIYLNESGVLHFNTNQPAPDNNNTNKIVVIDDLDNDDDLDADDTDFTNEKPKLIKTEKIDPFEMSSNETGSESKPMKLQPTTPSTPVKPLPNFLPANLSNKKASNKTFKLNEITNNMISQFNTQSLEELFNKTYNRILESDEIVSKNKEASFIRKKVLVESTSLPKYDNYLTNYIFEDIRKRIDLGLIWIYSNYVKLKQAYFKKSSIEKIKIKLQRSDSATESMQLSDEEDIIEVQTEENKTKKLQDLNKKGKEIINEINKYEAEYDRTLDIILTNLQQRHEQKDLLFSKVICQVPYLSDKCLNLLKTSCQNEQKFYFNMSTLSELIVTRFAKRNDLLNILLDFTHSTNTTIRENSIMITLNLYERKEFKNLIEEFAYNRLKYLRLTVPPSELFTDQLEDYTESAQWTEDTIKKCLYLYLDLMAANPSLIHPLSQVYIGSIPEVKKVILKMLEAPIKKMGTEITELLKLIEDFPQYSETLVLRIIHILTEKTVPSLELVNKVRNLYATKLPDVRFLIPILTGLTKAEVIAALPQLIKLSTAVVKEVFNRLLGINANVVVHKSPISPAELLTALHQIDQANCDLKTIINATSLCFAEKQIYTQEVLATVMQQLIDITPIPTLYMRTVIQSLTMYPKLSSFVVIMMQRLIGKQIWKYSKVWEGFIKCCQRIKPICHQVLLQLPPTQLREVFTTAPDLKEHVCKYVQSLNPQQRAQITTEILEIIENNTPIA